MGTENIENILIREFRDDDSIQRLTELLHAAYAPLAARGFRYLATHQDDSVTRDRLRSGISFVAELDGELVGTVTLRPPQKESSCAWYLQPGVWTFGQYAVRPDLQGQGLGRRMFDLVEDRARKEGAAELALDTADGAVELQRWYEELGFRPVQHVSWDDTNYRSVVLSKPLTAAAAP